MPVGANLPLFSLTQLLYSLSGTALEGQIDAAVECVALCDFSSSRKTPPQRARRAGVNDVGCSVFIGFADINKSRTCA